MQNLLLHHSGSRRSLYENMLLSRANVCDFNSDNIIKSMKGSRSLEFCQLMCV